MEAFAGKAREVGIKAILLSDLAKSLGMSKKTLYKYFPSKEAITYELIVRWERRVNEPVVFIETDIVGSIKGWAKRWVNTDAQFCVAFWRDLRSEYPDLYSHYEKAFRGRVEIIRKIISPYMREDLAQDFSWAAYKALLRSAARPEMYQRLGISREECILNAVDFWVVAALDRDKVDAATHAQ
ncbi:TetR/AcrR family transcriptional regulator [Aurantivibrio plasticivorans]